MIFLLTSFSGIGQHTAQGINLIFFIPTCVVAIWVNWKNKNIKKKTALVVIISGIIGAIAGAKFSMGIDVATLRKFFGYFLICIAGFEIFNLIVEYKKLKSKY